jgi:hypothetical protein
MPKAGFEPEITASERSKNVHASDRWVTPTGFAHVNSPPPPSKSLHNFQYFKHRTKFQDPFAGSASVFPLRLRAFILLALLLAGRRKRKTWVVPNGTISILNFAEIVPAVFELEM